MATIRRIHPIVYILLVAALIPVATLVQSDPEDEVAGDRDVARQLRSVLGFGPMDALPALAGEDAHDAMIHAAQVFLGQDEEALSALVADYGHAEKELVRRITWGDDVEQGYTDLAQARSAVVYACPSLVASLAAETPSPLAELAANVQENLALDHDLRTVDLTAPQRSAIQSAQRDRDKVIRNALNWHSHDKLLDAGETYEEALASILDEDQLSALSEARVALDARLFEMIDSEGYQD